MRLRTICIISFVLVAVAGGGYGWYRRKLAAPVESSGLPTATAEHGPIQRSVASTGRVVSNLDVDIKCKASGTVITLPVDVSDRVKRGDLLLALDPVDEQRTVAQAAAALDSSRAHLAQAKQNLLIAQSALGTSRLRAEAALASAKARSDDAEAKARRMLQLREKKLASQEDADTAETARLQAAADLGTAQAQIEELKAQELALEVRQQDIRLAESAEATDSLQLEESKQRLADTTVLAPIDGVVALRNVQIGTIISSGITNVGGGTTVLTLSDLSHIFILASVDESDIGVVQLGQEVVVTTDAFVGRRFHGKVVRIATRGANVSNVVTFEVKIEVTDERRTMLKPEMTANVEIVVDRREDAVTVPVEALSRRKGGWIAQVRQPDGSFAEREVKVGISDGERSEVSEGIAAGETVQLRKAEAASKWKAPTPSLGMPMGGPGRRH